MSFCLLTSILTATLTVLIFSSQIVSILDAQTIGNTNSKKIVVLNFDDGRKSQFTQAKPILDKYGFKATFYV
ncbi:MAG TPA: polysaccharide deacetylase family protein, partial [Nitrososphaeraceae archaeon]